MFLRTYTAIVWIVTSTFLCAAASGQVEDNCRDVLLYAGKNTSIDNYQNTVASNVYQKLCSGSSAKEGWQGTAGLAAIIEEIPIKFNIGGGSQSERVEHFCKEFSDQYKSTINHETFNSTVVTEAVQAWGNCVSAKDVAFKPQLTTTKLVIGVKRKTEKDVSVQGISYEAKLLKCTVPNADGVAHTAAANQDTRKKLDANYWTITCDRLPTVMPDGSTEYAKADISVSTTSDALLMSVPAEAKLSYQWSSQFDEQMKKLQRRRLECHSAEEQTAGSYPYVEAKIPLNTPNRNEYTVTGGGCRIPGSDTPTNRTTPVYGHNPPIMVSRPTADGWACKAGDPPNIPLPQLPVTAEVIFCRIAP